MNERINALIDENNGLKALFEGMEDGPIHNLESFQMVQLLTPATEKIDRLMKSER